MNALHSNQNSFFDNPALKQTCLSENYDLLIKDCSHLILEFLIPMELGKEQVIREVDWHLSNLDDLTWKVQRYAMDFFIDSKFDMFQKDLYPVYQEAIKKFSSEIIAFRKKNHIPMAKLGKHTLLSFFQNYLIHDLRILWKISENSSGQPAIDSFFQNAVSPFTDDLLPYIKDLLSERQKTALNSLTSPHMHYIDSLKPFSHPLVQAAHELMQKNIFWCSEYFLNMDMIHAIFSNTNVIKLWKNDFFIASTGQASFTEMLWKIERNEPKFLSCSQFIYLAALKAKLLSTNTLRKILAVCLKEKPQKEHDTFEKIEGHFSIIRKCYPFLEKVQEISSENTLEEGLLVIFSHPELFQLGEFSHMAISIGGGLAISHWCLPLDANGKENFKPQFTFISDLRRLVGNTYGIPANEVKIHSVDFLDWLKNANF